MVNRKPASSTQDTKGAVINAKNKDRHLVVPRVNSKLKSRKGNYLPESYDVYRLQDVILREIFQEQFSIKLKSQNLTIYRMDGMRF